MQRTISQVVKTKALTAIRCLLLAILVRAGTQTLALALTLGTTNSGSISWPGQHAGFKFTGTAGQRLYYDALDLDYENITVTLYAPNGSVVSGFSTNHSSDFGPFYLSENGGYTLLFQGVGDTIGDYNFRLLDVANTPLVGYGTNIVGQLNPRSSAAVYRFNGTNGQRLAVTNISASSTNANWRLISSADETLFSTNIAKSPGEIVLPATGVYVLLIEGLTENAGVLDFTVRVSLVSNPSGGTSGFGTVRSGAISTGQTNAFTYTASAGTAVYFDALASAVPANVCLYDPLGNSVPGFCVNAGADAGPFILPRSGTYRLEVVGTGFANYSFRLLDANANATALTIGATYAQTLTPGFRTDIYRFTGAAGQRIYFDSLDPDSVAVTAQLIRPDGSVFLENLDAAADAGPFTLTQPGSYLLAVANLNGDPAAHYSFRVIDGAQIPATPLAFDMTINGVLNPGSSADLYRFTGTAGQRLYFQGAATNTSGVWYLFDPQDQIVNGSPLANDFEQTLTQPGTYLLAVFSEAGTDAVPYSIRLITPDTTTNAINLGATVSDVLAEPGQENRYTFSGLAGQRLYFDTLDADDSFGVSLSDPQGDVVFIGDAKSDFGPITLESSGTYTMVFASNGRITGAYQFRLIDAGAAPAQLLILDTTITGVLNPGTETDLYRITGMAGQRLYFDGASTNTSGLWYLFDPANNLISGTSLSADFESTLPISGTYLLSVFGDIDSNPVPYSIRIVTPDTSTVPLGSFGTTISGTLTELGQEIRYTFSGSAGQRLYYDALDSDGDTIEADVVSPDGETLFLGGNAETDLGPFTLNSSGTYTLALKLLGNAVSSYKFRLIDVGVAPAQSLTLDTAINGVLSPGTAANLYRIVGTAGQRLFFDGASTNTSGFWFLYEPDNNFASSATLAADFEITLAHNGTYLLVLGNQSGTNPVPYSIRVVTPGTISAAYVLGSGVTNSLTEPGEERRYTFTGTAGQRLYYDALDADFDPINVSLYDPSGALFQIFTNADRDVGLFTLAHNGTYTLAFKGVNEYTNDYRFRLMDLAAAPLIVYGTAVTNQLQPQIKTDLYRISATAGQRISITNLSSSSNADWSLLGPNNAKLLSANIQTNLGDITLPVSGTYALAIIGASDLAGALDYRFRVSLLSSSNGTPASFGTVQSGTTAPNQTNSFTFTGTAGLAVYFDDLTNTFAACYQLLDPNGSQVFSICPSADSGPYFLPTNGVYTLRVIGFADGAFRFQLLNLLSATTSNIVFGTTYTRTLSPGFRTDVYRFTGAAGQRLLYDSLKSEFGPIDVRLYSPSGVNIYSGNADDEPGPFTLNEAGVYYVVFESATSDSTISYSFRMIDVAVSPALALTLDTQINGNLVPGTRSDAYRFNGTAGQRLYFAAQFTNSGSFWYLYGPQNVEIDARYVSDDFAVTLSQTGQHLLVVGFGGDTNPAPYSIRVVTPTDTTNALTVGATITGTIAELGESDYYTFTGTAGQRLYYDALQNDYDAIGTRLISPSGTVLFEDNSDSDSSLFTLTEAGTYTLQIYSDGAAGSYSFRLIDVAQTPAIALTLDTQINGRLLPGTRTDLYRFTGSAGQHLYFDAMPTNGNCSWYLYGPQDQELSGAYGTDDHEAVLPLSGQYVLLVGFGDDTNPVPYSIRVVTPIDSTNALALGAIVNGTISEAGESDYYTFTGTAGQRLYYDALDYDFDPINARLISPAGIVVFEGNADSEFGPFTLTETGPYLLRIFGDGSTANYSFRILDAATAPVLAYDTVVTNRLTNSFSAALYQVPTAPNLRLYFDALSAPTNAEYYLYDPAGRILNGAPIGQDFEVTPLVTGTHLLVVNSIGSGSVPYSFRIFAGNHPPVLAPIPDRTVHLGTLVTTTANANDPDGPTDTLTFSLLTPPTGAAIGTSSGAFSWAATNAPLGLTPLRIRVADDGSPILSATQTFNVRIEPRLMLSAPVLSNLQTRLTWSAITNTSYRVQYQTNLSVTNWNSLAGDVTATATNATKVDTNSFAVTNRFYRVQILP